MEPDVSSRVVSRPIYDQVKSVVPLSDNNLFICEGSVSEQQQSMYLHSECPKKSLVCIISDHQNIQTESAADSLVKCQKMGGFIDSLPQKLSFMTLSSRAYLEGSEGFLWRIYRVLLELGMDPQQIIMQPPVTNNRDIFCPHCFTITEGVNKTVSECRQCERLLYVSDHFSKRHGAYFSYQVNAEDPNDIPEIKELRR
ncbi:dimethylamine monooxygenase subunit DmmA family protein [Marinomonas algarum]|uniref:Dimethylamine monooxygenase subunit DmmA-like C-terminal domain-containing protein n=1 Tax=Marinomonas algarum TaxID=2883105 RepID=A0A9X1IRJ0_9GAMM|nr:dimethylamine monooxygenase subunit DmmA family protein [Marinomonas algarum]MCB5162833.1 hypothetical protein [Marinomonas algarum]